MLNRFLFHQPIFLILFPFLFFIDTKDISQKKIEEYNIKAAFIYNFTKYIEWKDTDNPYFVIGVLGNSEITNPLQEIANKKQINNRVIRITQSNNVEKISQSNIIFIPQENSSQFQKTLNSINKDNVLIITESGSSLVHESDITFIVKEGKIKFEISKKALDKEGLKFSSQILRLAIITE